MPAGGPGSKMETRRKETPLFNGGQMGKTELLGAENDDFSIANVIGQLLKNALSLCPSSLNSFLS